MPRGVLQDARVVAVAGEHFLRIGGITTALRAADPNLAWEWDVPASRFLVPPERADVEISVRSGDVAPSTGALLFDSGAVWRMYRDGTRYRIECRADGYGDDPYKVALFDESFTRGEIVLSPAAAKSRTNPLQYPLDEILTAHLLGRGRGVELHSCGVIDRAGRGRLFVGVSGAGKTTTARLWEEEAASIVSDDRVILREHDGGMWIYGTPWHGEAEISEPRRAPLAGVYLLVQAERNELRPLSHAAAVARLFRCAFPPFYDERSLDFTVAFLAGVVASVPVRELHFTRDRDAVALVLREAA